MWRFFGVLLILSCLVETITAGNCYTIINDSSLNCLAPLDELRGWLRRHDVEIVGFQIVQGGTLNFNCPIHLIYKC